MEVNKKRLSEIFGVSVRTIQNWQEQGMPVVRGGGKGNEVLFESAAAIEWYSARDAAIENEKLRKEVEDLRIASESDLQPGTIEYERHRLTRAQADAQELKNAKESAEVVETAFCTFVLSRVAGEIASILDGIPLSVQRRFPELENRHIDFLKKDIIKAMNKAAALDEMITASSRAIVRPCSIIRAAVCAFASCEDSALSRSAHFIFQLRFVHSLPARNEPTNATITMMQMPPGFTGLSPSTSVRFPGPAVLPAHNIHPSGPWSGGNRGHRL